MKGKELPDDWMLNGEVGELERYESTQVEIIEYQEKVPVDELGHGYFDLLFLVTLQIIHLHEDHHIQHLNKDHRVELTRRNDEQETPDH